MIEDDLDYGDDTPLPDAKTKDARQWLAAITRAEKTFEDYQSRNDSIDKLYANLRELATDSRDRQFQMFWANIEVLGPSVYARAPVPVVVPKFKDRRPLYRVASELLERCSVVTFDLNDINSTMLLVRDDLNINARGAVWVRYETKAEGEHNTERVCIEHLDRRDFIHEPARKWAEVGWVARRAWMSKREMRKRFRSTSGDAYKDAAFEVRREDKDNGGADSSLKAGVWEIWSKDQNKVVWVSEGVKVCLDEGEPHLRLEGFYPCPRPAYGTLQRRSLIPVPDMVYYKDQLEEINELTGRISALSTAVQVRGFYPSGAGEIGDAIEAALKSQDNRQVMVPISNWAAFGGGAAKDTIVWLPIDMIVTTIAQLVELRRQVIDDVYQIMGLSDIMRGTTDAQETLGAQQIKAQYGSVRIRNKQQELVRIARDIVRISAEIMAEDFDTDTLIDMSQMVIPTDAEIKRQVEELTQQAEAQAEQQFQQMLQQAMQAPEAQQMVQQNPQQAQQLAAQAKQQVEQQAVAQLQPQIKKLEDTPTVEKVAKFLSDEKIRPFVLDIETDSTIQPDEDAEKQRRNEFLQAFGGTVQQLAGLIQIQPAAAPLAAEIIKFAVAPYRAGRELEGVIEEFAQQMVQQASQPKPDPAQQEMEAEQARKDKEAEATAVIEAKRAETDAADREQQRAIDAEKHQADMEKIGAEAERDRQKHELEMDGIRQKTAAAIEQIRTKTVTNVEETAIKADIAVETAEQQADIRSQQAVQQSEQAERSFEQQSELVAKKAQQGGK